MLDDVFITPEECDSLYDYVAKPLAWVMPLGSVVAAGLGAWFGQRVRQRQAG